MIRFALLAAILLVAAACAPRPVWVEKGPPADGEALTTVVAGPVADLPRLREQALDELRQRIAAPDPALVPAPLPDDRYGRLRAALTAPPAIPAPPAPALRDTYLDGDRAWVLAEVRAGAWIDRLRLRCAEIDREVQAAVSTLPAEADALDALRCLRTAAPLLDERAAIGERIARIDAARVPAAPAGLERSAVERRLRTLVERATVELVALDASTRLIVTAVGDSLSRRGWRMVGRDGWARLSVNVATTERTIDGILRIDGVLDGEITVVGGSSDLVHITDRGDGGDPLLVRDRLGQRLGMRLAEELDRRLLKAAEAR